MNKMESPPQPGFNTSMPYPYPQPPPPPPPPQQSKQNVRSKLSANSSEKRYQLSALSLYSTDKI